MEKIKKQLNSTGDAVSNNVPEETARATASPRVAREKRMIKKEDIDIDSFKTLLRSRRAKRVTRDTPAHSYSYIYDATSQDKRYAKDLGFIENRLTDLGMAGKIHRLSRFKNIKEIIDDDARFGIKSFVVVGGDETFLHTLTAGATQGVCYGFIPLAEKSEVAKLLGIKDRFDACQVLSARLIEPIDLGKINSQIFFSSIKIPHCRAEIICDGHFSVSAYQDRDIEIFNVHLPKNEEDVIDFLPNPKDGALELVVRRVNKLSLFGGWKHALSRSGRDSIFFFRDAQIVSKDPVTVVIDGKKTMHTKPKITVIPNALKLIVGKSRTI